LSCFIRKQAIIEQKLENDKSAISQENQPTKRKKLHKIADDPKIEIPQIPLEKPNVQINKNQDEKQAKIPIIENKPTKIIKEIKKEAPKPQVFINPADFFSMNLKKLEGKSSTPKNKEQKEPETAENMQLDEFPQKPKIESAEIKQSKEIMDDILNEYEKGPKNEHKEILSENTELPKISEQPSKLSEKIQEKMSEKIPEKIQEQAKKSDLPKCESKPKPKISIPKPPKNDMPKEPVVHIISSMWVDKYAPKNMSEIIGNSDILAQLKTWMSDWVDVVIKGNKKKVDFRKSGYNQYNSYKSDISNPNAKACLLSGPPGIGKTVAARLVAKEMGYEILETNASDQRSKNVIESLLSDAVDNQNIISYTKEDQPVKLNSMYRKQVIIMDEVDGVSGTNDRGGITALIKIIEQTKVPVICICNDRQSTKIRSLASHCYDLRFNRYFFIYNWD